MPGHFQTRISPSGLLSSSFKFKAIIASEGGVKKVQIDSRNVALADWSAKDLAKVYQRVTDLSQQLEPVLMTKANSDPESSEQRPSLGQERLLALVVIIHVASPNIPPSQSSVSQSLVSLRRRKSCQPYWPRM